jgi:hypothetical protein
MNRDFAHHTPHGGLAQSPDGRRRQLRLLLLAAADTARQDRRVTSIASRMTPPDGRAVRDRLARLLTAV